MYAHWSLERTLLLTVEPGSSLLTALLKKSGHAEMKRSASSSVRKESRVTTQGDELNEYQRAALREREALEAHQAKAREARKAEARKAKAREARQAKELKALKAEVGKDEEALEADLDDLTAALGAKLRLGEV